MRIEGQVVRHAEGVVLVLSIDTTERGARRLMETLRDSFGVWHPEFHDVFERLLAEQERTRLRVIEGGA